MTKPKSKPKASTRLVARRTAKPSSRGQSTSAPSRAAARPNTKHARIIAMLRKPAGATIAAIMAATDWQQHSVRGFLAGVVRKKLGLNLTSEQTDKGRVYRIKDGKAAPAKEQLLKCYQRIAADAAGLPMPAFVFAHTIRLSGAKPRAIAAV